MSDLVRIGGVLERPVRLLLLSLLGLAAWGIVTLLAVRLAVASAWRGRAVNVER